MKKVRLTLLLVASFLMEAPVVFGNEIELIKQNYVQMLLAEQDHVKELINNLVLLPKETIIADQVVTELMQLYPVDADAINILIKNMQENGSWHDINYQDTNLSGWAPKAHVERILILTKAYYSGESIFYHSPEIEKAIHASLSFWYNEKLISSNWWYNDIGIPQLLGNILILFENKLTATEKQQGIEILARSEIKHTGQNKVWLSGNVLTKALLENDFTTVKLARNAIASEIRNDRFEGIKADFSFHQHGAQQQLGNYGMAFIRSMAIWAQVFNGTTLQFDRKQLDMLSELINNGYARILWNQSMDVASLGRQYTRQVQHHKAFAVALSANMLSVVDTQNSSLYKQLVNNYLSRSNKEIHREGLYHFWTSDYTVQRNKHSMISVKMASVRVTGSEAGNGDNLKGYYLADGATYLYQSGDEYYNIFPCWNWQKIPGTTTYETNLPLKQLTWDSYKNKASFVGNVNNGQTGISAQHLNRDGLQAHKAWIFTKDMLVCLGAGIQADSGCVVTTSIEQRICKGDLYYLNAGKWENETNIEISNRPDVRFFHDKTGYIALNCQTVKATVENRTGRWNEVTNIYPDSVIEKQTITSLWIDHGANPDNASYQYILLPDVSRKSVKEFKATSIKVLYNTARLQAVFIPKENTWYIASYCNLDFSIHKNLHITGNCGGLFMIKEINPHKYDITIADPTQSNNAIKLNIGNKEYIVELPQGKLKGTSTTISINTR